MVAVLVLAVLLIGKDAPEERVIRFETRPPEGGRFHLAPDNPGPVAVSPDGRMITYAGRTADGVIQLWVRPLDEAEARPLAGTENAQYPFWSPDSRRIGFFARGKLRVVEAVGGPPLALCDATDGKGGSWSRGRRDRVLRRTTTRRCTQWWKPAENRPRLPSSTSSERTTRTVTRGSCRTVNIFSTWLVPRQALSRKAKRS